MNKTHSLKLDLTGKKFGKGTVLHQVQKPDYLKRNGRYWLVLCDCGNKSIVDGSTLKRNRWKSCGCIHKQDLTGKIFGKGTVLKLLKTETRNGKNNRVWLLQCQCGNKYKCTTNGLVWRNNKSCGCLNERHGKNHHLYKGYEDISGDYWCKLKKGAVNRSLQFEVSIEYAWKLFLDQNKKCALTGWDITLGKWGTQTASIDRKNSSKGYTADNIQWLHKDINKMKSNLAESYFIEICKTIVERSKLSELTTLHTE